MPDETEQGEAKEIEVLPGEDIHALLKRISHMPRKEGESRFVNIRGGIGPISVIPADFPPNRTCNLMKRTRSTFGITRKERGDLRGISPDSKDDSDPANE